jgi:hypothetical protein
MTGRATTNGVSHHRLLGVSADSTGLRHLGGGPRAGLGERSRRRAGTGGHVNRRRAGTGGHIRPGGGQHVAGELPRPVLAQHDVRG